MSDPTAEAHSAASNPANGASAETTAAGAVVGDSGGTAPVSPADAQAVVDRLIRELEAGLGAEQAVYVVAVLASRSASELHKLARAQATATKGEAAWGGWASLQNAARRLVLDAASARDAAAKLAGHQR